MSISIFFLVVSNSLSALWNHQVTTSSNSFVLIQSQMRQEPQRNFYRMELGMMCLTTPPPPPKCYQANYRRKRKEIFRMVNSRQVSEPSLFELVIFVTCFRYLYDELQKQENEILPTTDNLLSLALLSKPQKNRMVVVNP
jgi:hypothetical protein